jgi:Domain of unknown function (DUF4124)
LSLLAVAGIAAAGATVTYRWVDTDGVHYSDQPHQGAEKILLGQSQTYSSSDAEVSAPTSARKGRSERASAEFGYDSCAVVQPAEDQVLIDVESVTVAVQLQPAKRSADRVVLSFDGKAIEPESSDQLEFKFTPIERGTHTVAAVVRGADGKNLCQSTAVNFHVRQPAVLAPLNPNRPRKH